MKNLIRLTSLFLMSVLLSCHGSHEGIGGKVREHETKLSVAKLLRVPIQSKVDNKERDFFSICRKATIQKSIQTFQYSCFCMAMVNEEMAKMN